MYIYIGQKLTIPYFLAKKRPKKQQKEDKPKADRSEILKDEMRDSTPSNRSGKSKSGDNNRGGTSTPK